MLSPCWMWLFILFELLGNINNELRNVASWQEDDTSINTGGTFHVTTTQFTSFHLYCCNPESDPNYILFRVLANSSISTLLTHYNLAITIWLKFAKSPLITFFLFKTFNDWSQRTKIQQENPTILSSLMDFQMLREGKEQNWKWNICPNILALCFQHNHEWSSTLFGDDWWFCQ